MTVEVARDGACEREAPLGVPALNVVGLARSVQLLQRVGAGGLQQAVAPVRNAGVGRHERLGDEARDGVDDIEGVEILAARHLRRGLQGEAAGEGPKPAEDGGVALGQQAVAPVKRCGERALTRQSGAAAPGEQAEAVVQPDEHVLAASRVQIAATAASS